MKRFTLFEFRKSILYEDDDLIVCHKPSGLAVQNANPGVTDLESLARTYLKGGYVGLVHRLDQPVEGLVLMAKTPLAAGELSTQLRNGQMVKEYQAVVTAEIDAFAGRSENGGEETFLESFLVWDPRTHCAAQVPEERKGAKKARLAYRILKKRQDVIPDELCLLLAVRLFTGRHHQIRVQLAAAGLPILGDRKYGKAFPGMNQEMGLCATSLCATHPVTGRLLHWECQPLGRSFLLFQDKAVDEE
ncbi:MAG: RluA family pseudouridine synthase [Blautia sp.]|nr:RluA family pseudouridine synthase [Blautia sp.]